MKQLITLMFVWGGVSGMCPTVPFVCGQEKPTDLTLDTKVVRGTENSLGNVTRSVEVINHADWLTKTNCRDVGVLGDSRTERSSVFDIDHDRVAGWTAVSGASFFGQGSDRFTQPITIRKRMVTYVGANDYYANFFTAQFPCTIVPDIQLSEDFYTSFYYLLATYSTATPTPSIGRATKTYSCSGQFIAIGIFGISNMTLDGIYHDTNRAGVYAKVIVGKEITAHDPRDVLVATGGWCFTGTPTMRNLVVYRSRGWNSRAGLSHRATCAIGRVASPFPRLSAPRGSTNVQTSDIAAAGQKNACEKMPMCSFIETPFSTAGGENTYPTDTNDPGHGSARMVQFFVDEGLYKSCLCDSSLGGLAIRDSFAVRDRKDVVKVHSCQNVMTLAMANMAIMTPPYKSIETCTGREPDSPELCGVLCFGKAGTGVTPDKTVDEYIGRPVINELKYGITNEMERRVTERAGTRHSEVVATGMKLMSEFERATVTVESERAKESADDVLMAALETEAADVVKERSENVLSDVVIGLSSVCNAKASGEKGEEDDPDVDFEENVEKWNWQEWLIIFSIAVACGLVAMVIKKIMKQMRRGSLEM